jgi:hypothetical protein
MIMPCLLVLFQPINAKVEAPNYDFSVETLNDFFPGKKVSDLESKYGASTTMSKDRRGTTKKFNVAHVRYKFPVLIQDKDGLVQDFFARLPSYFLHDIFLKSLQTKLGKQTEYKKTGEAAYYVWKDKDFKYVYSAACTITCFPIFFAGEPVGSSSPSILEQMNKKN